MIRINGHSSFQECRRIGIECIVAPYEADAQLAYLCKENMVDLVITEDSDLLVFGCQRVGEGEGGSSVYPYTYMYTYYLILSLVSLKKLTLRRQQRVYVGY